MVGAIMIMSGERNALKRNKRGDEMSELKLTQKTSGSISKFGLRNCLLAYKLNQVDGEGATVISYTAGIETIANANRAIDAGREYAKKMNIPTSILIMMAEGFCRN